MTQLHLPSTTATDHTLSNSVPPPVPPPRRPESSSSSTTLDASLEAVQHLDWHRQQQQQQQHMDYQSGYSGTAPTPLDLQQSYPRQHPHPADAARVPPQPQTFSTHPPQPALPPRQPPTRSATYPLPQPPVHYQPQPQQPAYAAPAPVVVDPQAAALAAHHAELVAYYWHYAQHGLLAPVNEGNEWQKRARDEAVGWARSQGIQVVDPADMGMVPVIVGQGATVGGAGVAQQENPLPSAQRPLPQPPVTHSHSALSQPSGVDQATGLPCSNGHLPLAEPSQRPLPTPSGPPTTSRPLPTPSAVASVPSAAPPTRPPLPSTPSQLMRSTSLASAPSAPPPQVSLNRSSSVVVTPTVCPLSATGGKRPLPMPPGGGGAATAPSVAVLSDRMAQLALAHAVSTSTVPVVNVPGVEEPAAAPTVPSFSFPDDNENGVPYFAVTDDSSPAPPTFSFGSDDDDQSSHASLPSISFGSVAAPAPPPKHRLHPRHDPSHPSHYLYHPTSSPLSQRSSAAEAGTLVCISCATPIYGRALRAMGHEWHPECFVCQEEGCGVALEFVQFDGRVGGESGEGNEVEVWCMVHFEERFAHICYHCHTPISSSSYLPITDPLLPPLPTSASSSPSSTPPETRYYHPLHFFCASCGDPFVDPSSLSRLDSASSSTTTAPGAGEVVIQPYIVRKGHPYCERCDLRMWRDKCRGCKKGIAEGEEWVELGGSVVEEDEEYGRASKPTEKWHVGCWKCMRCSKVLSDTYLMHQGADGKEQAYCHECFDLVE